MLLKTVSTASTYSVAAVRGLALPRLALFRLQAVSAKNAVFVKNSGAVAIGSGAAAVSGFIYWWLAARFFPPAVIGQASALLSLMGLVGLVGEVGLGTLLAGEIVRYPGRERGLIAAAALTSLLLSLTAGAIAVAVFFVASDALDDGGSPGLAGLLFLLGCGLTGLVFVVDHAFVGMLRSSIRMLRNLLFSACKLLLLVGVMVWLSGESAILATWVVALIMSFILIEMQMRRHGDSLIRPPDFPLLYALRRKAVDHYLLDLAGHAPSLILPYLVTVLLSPASNAAFSAIWMIFVVASVGPGALATVLFPVLRAAPDQYGEKMILSLLASLCFATGFGLFVFRYSEDLLRLFNPLYLHIAGDSLRFLGFGMIGAVIKFQIWAGARLSNRMRQASGWFGIGGLFEIAGAMIGCRVGGLQGFVVGWVVATAIEAGLLLLIALLTVGRKPPLAHGIDDLAQNPGSDE